MAPMTWVINNSSNLLRFDPEPGPERALVVEVFQANDRRVAEVGDRGRGPGEVDRGRRRRDVAARVGYQLEVARVSGNRIQAVRLHKAQLEGSGPGEDADTDDDDNDEGA